MSRDWNAHIAGASCDAGRPLDADVVEELAQHAASAFDAARARGESDEEANAYVTALIATWIERADALSRPATLTAPVPPPSTSRLAAGLLRDLRYGARVLMRQRGFALVALATIALAIGLTTTLFGVLDAVLLRPLPWPNADRLVRLAETHVGASRQIGLAMTNATYFTLLAQPSSTMEAAGAWYTGAVSLVTDAGGDSVQMTRVTPSVFGVLGAVPLHGRAFSADDAPEVMVSYGLWLERFGGSLEVIGRPVRVNGESLTLAGVMPPGFMFPDPETRLWRPVRLPPPPAISTMSVIARLRPGATPAAAAAEATARARASAMSPNATMAYFGTMGPAAIVAQPALDALTHDVRPGIIALFVAVALLLVTAIANIASLQLARATTRYREMAIRSALGAGTARLAQQLIVEQVLLAVVGGALGVALALTLQRALPAVLPADFPRLADIGLHSSGLLFALGVSALTGVVLGALPAFHLRRMRLTQTLTEAATGAIGGTRQRVRVGIMTGQIAIACTLLVGALLLGRSFVAMVTEDRGFQPAHLLTARLNLPPALASQARIDATEALVARIQALPDAPVAAVTTGLPLSNSENISGFDMPSLRPPVGVSINAHAVRSVVTPGYLRALGLRLSAGRDFTPDDDSAAAPKVVIVNHTFAAQYLTARAVGDRIRNFMDGDNIDFEVVGIVEDMQRHGLTDRIQPEIYSLLRQSPRPSPAQDLVIRTTADPARLADPLRQIARQLAPDATLGSIATMEDRVLGSLARPRLYAVLIVGFAATALIIASVGLVGVLSYSVAQRTREFALRLALGARPSQVLRLVLAQGVVVTGVGIAFGLGAAFVLTRYLSSLLYGISTHDRLSFVGAPLALAAVAIAACLGPALRALRVSPLAALRS